MNALAVFLFDETGMPHGTLVSPGDYEWTAGQWIGMGPMAGTAAPHTFDEFMVYEQVLVP